jgi:hypothetical protein
MPEHAAQTRDTDALISRPDARRGRRAILLRRRTKTPYHLEKPSSPLSGAFIPMEMINHIQQLSLVLSDLIFI